jgi:Zn-finger nucleic acid-binding protein
MATTELVCPKCNGVMRSYERSGVTLDQCGECRGIFLDREELEHLVDAEQSWQRSEPPPRERSSPLRLPYGDRDDDDDDDDRGRYGGGYQKRRKRSFFDDLFD